VPAIVTGFGNVPLGAMRALGRRGIPVFAAAPRAKFERGSRWYRPIPGGWTDEGLESNLRACPLERAALIPISDRDALEASRLPAGLRERFPTAIARPEIVAAFLDKGSFSELLAQHGVAHPRTWILESPDDLAGVGDAALESAFLKPRDSYAFSKRFEIKSLRPKGRDAIFRALEEMTGQGFTMVLQEYIQGPTTNGYLVDGFRDRTGRITGLFARRRLRQFPLDFGNSSALLSVPLKEIEPAVEALRGFLHAIDYRGIFNAEFKRDDRDGTFHLFEINPRAWWWVEFAARCGVDAVTMAYEDALGLDVTPSTGYDEGRTAFYPEYDVDACRALRREGKLSLREIAKFWIGSDQMIFAWDDPIPALYNFFGKARAWVGRRLPWRA